MSDTNELGVIASIEAFLGNVGIKPFTLAEIHADLVKKFPERDPDAMLSTIRRQVPYKLRDEKGYAFRREDELYIVVPPK